jgi:hypothetical protein
LSIENDVTQEESDAAIVQCLRIFAARGRQLRLQRERDQAAQRGTEREDVEVKMENDKTPTPPAPKESECPS